MTTTLTYKDIEYTLTRSPRKTASIYIERDGQVSLLVPDDLEDIQIDDLIEKKRYWIYKNLAEWRDLNASRVEREYVNGEGFLYLGRSYQLKLVEEQEAPLVLRNGYFCLRCTDSTNAAAIFDDTFRSFYREKGMERIPERVEIYKSRMGVEPASIKVMELQNRWASYVPQNRLNFHWKCMMAPLTILDYIVVHELAHFHHRNHTEAFWNEVDKVMPDYRDRKDWLRKNGAGMDL